MITAAVLTAEYVRSRYPDARCFLVNSGQIAEDMPGIDIVYSSGFDAAPFPKPRTSSCSVAPGPSTTT